MRNRERVLKYKYLIEVLTSIFGIFPKKINYYLLLLFKNFPFKIGILLRYVTLRNCSKKCGLNVCVRKGVTIKKPYNISVGNNVSINEDCFIDGEGGIEIGSDTSIAHSVSIITFDHNFKDKNIPIKDQGITKGKIIIGDNVWIGARVIVLKKVCIMSGVIIAAGAVVTKNCAQDYIYGGIPANTIGKRA